MSSIARGRPSRRSAPRRSYVMSETSEEEDPGNVTPTPSQHDVEEEDEDDSTPVPKKPSTRRRSSRRTTADAPAPTPSTARPARRSRSRQRQSRAASSQVGESNDEGNSVASVEEPESPSQNVAARKRVRHLAES
ncbi:hypothetical protein AFLA_007878 [Aspergillus flavus NRRL3357]|nr:hypothetical protein AFLA_007878 [Aspergillus flavus NRRL3357]